MKKDPVHPLLAPLRRIITPAYQQPGQTWEVLECGHHVERPWVRPPGSYHPPHRRRCLLCRVAGAVS